MDSLPTKAQMANFAAFQYVLLYELRHLGGETQQWQWHALAAENLQDAQREALDWLVEQGNGEDGGGYVNPDIADLLDNFNNCHIVVQQICDCPPIDEDHPLVEAVMEAFNKQTAAKEAADKQLSKAERRQQFEALRKEFDE